MPCINTLRKRLGTILRGVIIIAAALTLANCAGTKPGTGYVEDTPDDIQKMIEKEYADAVCAVGTAIGPDEGTATRKATLQARAEIAREFKAQIDVLQKSYEESINDKSAEEYQQATEIFATLEVSGSQIAKSMVREEKDGTFSAKVLVVVSAEQLKAIMDEKMQAYTSFKASKAYKELEDRVARESEKRLVAGE